MRQRRLLVLIVIIAVAIGVAALLWPRAGGQERTQGGPPGAGRPAIVTVATARFEPIVISVRAVGTVEAAESITVTAQVTGRAERILFEPGQEVAAGDVLVKLDDARERAALQSAQAEERDARRQAERTDDLARRGLIAEAERDTARARQQSVTAAVAQARAALDERRILAPFAGTVGLRAISPGALIQPGDTITTLATAKQLKLSFRLPADLLAQLRTGLAVEARAAGFDEPFTGAVTRIDNAVDPATRSIALEATLLDAGMLKPGVFVSIDVALSQRRGVVVPEEAVVLEGEHAYVYTVGRDGTAQRRAVTLGERRAGHAELIDGVTAGETVITAGHQSLREGQPVQPARAERP